MIKKLWLILFFLFLSNNALAEYAFSLSEAQRLPPFCLGLSIDNFQNNAEHLKQNIKVPGEHTHHFCHGMKSILRGDYATAVNEFKYVQHHSKTKHVLIPATSLYKAEALGMLGKIREALEEYNKAIQLKKKYPHAYVKLANYYKKINQPQSAIDTIKLGLKFSPDSKMLQRKLKKLESSK